MVAVVTHTTSETVTDALRRALIAEGFAFAHGSVIHQALAGYGPLADWPTFADSWNHLDPDTYLDDRGRYRRRRHAVYSLRPDAPITREPHQPHYQSADYNRLFGGVERWFSPIDPAIGAGASLQTILQFAAHLFGSIAPGKEWRIEVHQFRIEARSGQAGLPTPEGVHRDGVDFVLVLLVGRANIASGTTTVYEPGGRPLGSFTLTDPCDAALVDDTRVAHGVTPVTPIDPARPAYRDVLVVTFRAATAR